MGPMQLPVLPCSTRIAGGSVDVDLVLFSFRKRVRESMYL